MARPPPVRRGGLHPPSCSFHGTPVHCTRREAQPATIRVNIWTRKAGGSPAWGLWSLRGYRYWNKRLSKVTFRPFDSLCNESP